MYASSPNGVSREHQQQNGEGMPMPPPPPAPIAKQHMEREWSPDPRSQGGGGSIASAALGGGGSSSPSGYARELHPFSALDAQQAGMAQSGQLALAETSPRSPGGRSEGGGVTLAMAQQSILSPGRGDADAHWLSTHASIANSVDQKVSALSRRTAAELRRAERERGEHSRRIDALEELCRQQLGQILDERFVMAREEVERASQRVRSRCERDVSSMSEVLHQHSIETQSVQEHSSETLKGLVKRVDANQDANQAGLEELRAWRREASQQLAEPVKPADCLSDALSEELSEKFAEKFEEMLSRERKQAHERLRSSCVELTSHLNELRQELIDQRQHTEKAEGRLEGRRERLRADLESQIAELGGALASRLQAKISGSTKGIEEQLGELQRDIASLRQETCQIRILSDAVGTWEERAVALEGSDEWLGGQVQLWRRESSEIHGSIASLQEQLRRESTHAQDAASEEARVVHLEVMSIDTRLTTLEERLAEDPGRRRYGALLRIAERSGNAETAGSFGGVPTATGGASQNVSGGGAAFFQEERGRDLSASSTPLAAGGAMR